MEISTFHASFNQWHHSFEFRPVWSLVIGWKNCRNFHRTVAWWVCQRAGRNWNGLSFKLILTVISEFMGKTFQAAQLTHERFLTIDHSCKIFFWYLPNWTSTNLWCVVLYATSSTTHQRLVEVQFGRYQKSILQEWSMVKKLSCVSNGSLKRFPHTFTTDKESTQVVLLREVCGFWFSLNRIWIAPKMGYHLWVIISGQNLF